MTTEYPASRSSEAGLRALMLASLDGDARAHRALLGALVPILTRYFVRRMGPSVDVEDIVQNTLISVHTKRATYDRSRPFSPWLFAIAHHRMVDHFRRAKVAVPIEDHEHELSVDSFDDASGARLDVDAMLAQLSPQQAEAIRLTKIDGLSVAEAAAITGMGESNVKVSVHRGLKALASRFAGIA